MFRGQKVVVVMPAYNAAQTLRRTYDEVMAQEIVDLVIVTDDASHDQTTAIARTLPQTLVHVHPENRGYGANQKTCYRLALDAGADIIIMIHPDYQYTPLLLRRHGLAGRQRAVSLRAGLADPRRPGPSRRHALVEVRLQPLPDPRRELPAGGPPVRVSHRLSGLLPRTAPRATLAGLFRRLRVRQPDPGPNPVDRPRHRRSELPHALRGPVLVDRPAALDRLRPGLPPNRRNLSPGQAAAGPLEAVCEGGWRQAG